MGKFNPITNPFGDNFAEGAAGGLADPMGEDSIAGATSRLLGLRTPSEALADISGQTAADAQRTAAELQEKFGREALAESEAAQLALEETLAPFVGFGVGQIPRLQALFGGNTAESIAASKPIMDLTKFARDRIASNPALQGIDPGIIDRAALTTGANLLSRERSDLEQAIRLGQASAAQRAAGQTETGRFGADLLTQIGNLRAAGGIGAAQSMGQGAQNIVGIGTTLAEAFR